MCLILRRISIATITVLSTVSITTPARAGWSNLYTSTDEAITRQFSLDGDSFKKKGENTWFRVSEKIYESQKEIGTVDYRAIAYCSAQSLQFGVVARQSISRENELKIARLALDKPPEMVLPEDVQIQLFDNACQQK